MEPCGNGENKMNFLSHLYIDMHDLLTWLGSGSTIDCVFSLTPQSG